MIHFEHVKTYNWLDAIRGMRNSWESWDKSDTKDLGIYGNDDEVIIGQNDWSLMMNLVKAGSDHAKFLRQVLVSVDISAPEYWWKEFDTYKVGTVANSTSMMHTLGKSNTGIPDEAFNLEDCDADLIERYTELLNDAHLRWVTSGKKKPSREWRQMLQLTSQAFIYKRTVTLNYAVLRSMYHSRKNHRLQEWRDFCDWCKTLPYADLITWKEEK